MLRGYAVPDVREEEARVRAGLAEDELMLRAAHGLAEVVAARARQNAPAGRACRVVVLAGPGDNGGDALHAAGLLADGQQQVEAVGIAPRLHAGGLAAAHAADVPVHEVDPHADRLPEAARAAVSQADLVVDGLLGIGGRPGLRGAMATAVEQVPDTAYVLSVDLPSGVDPDGLRRPGDAVLADETVTFGMLKPVHLLPATEPAVGRLTVVDIGVRMTATPVVERLEPADVARGWPVPGPDDHKYTRGVLGVVAGSEAYPGAAVLVTTAAVEAGAGMVRYLGPRRAEDLVLDACPEVVPGEGRVQALVVGPGVPGEEGGDAGTPAEGQMSRVLDTFDEDVPLVVDAGALELLAGWLAGGGRRGAPTLLTPHAGELARMLTTLDPDPHEGSGAGTIRPRTTRADVDDDPLGHARRLAGRTGCTVLLKGATTLVVDPDPGVPVRAQADGPAWLATAGAGDVLAGLAGMLLAAGLEPREAGSLAALVHGTAADRANPGGPVRALAVAHGIPRTVAALLRQ